jgi:hypothetical protein
MDSEEMKVGICRVPNSGMETISSLENQLPSDARAGEEHYSPKSHCRHPTFCTASIPPHKCMYQNENLDVVEGSSLSRCDSLLGFHALGTWHAGGGSMPSGPKTHWNGGMKVSKQLACAMSICHHTSAQRDISEGENFDEIRKMDGGA